MSVAIDAAKKLQIFEWIPRGHIAFAVTDASCEPLAREGEVLVVEDEPRTYPVEGEWHLFQWIREPRHEWERATVHQTTGIAKQRKGLWGHYPLCSSLGGLHFAGDFGFTFEQMTDKIRGTVVGIYRPADFD